MLLPPTVMPLMRKKMESDYFATRQMIIIQRAAMSKKNTGNVIHTSVIKSAQATEDSDFQLYLSHQTESLFRLKSKARPIQSI